MVTNGGAHKKMSDLGFIPSSPSLHLGTTHFLRNCYFQKKNKLNSDSFDNDVLHWLLGCIDFAEIKTIYFLCKLFASSGFFSKMVHHHSKSS